MLSRTLERDVRRDARIDEFRFDAIAAQRGVENRSRLCENLPRGDHVIAGAENGQQRRRDRTHARAEHDSLFRALEIGDEPRGGRRGRVAEPPIERGRPVLEHLSMPNGGWRRVGRGEHDRLAEWLVGAVRVDADEARIETKGHGSHSFVGKTTIVPKESVPDAAVQCRPVMPSMRNIMQAGAGGKHDHRV